MIKPGEELPFQLLTRIPKPIIRKSPMSYRRWLARVPGTLFPCFLLLTGVSNAFAFRVIGYFPSWQGSVSGIQFSKVTHVNYAFLLPNSNGSLQAIDNASK